MQTLRAVTACASGPESERLAALLEEMGYEVVAAFSAAEALRRVREACPALVVSDAVLPGGDGLALARAIAASALNRYPFVTLLCPPGLVLPGAESLAAYGAALVYKPATAEAIRDAVSALTARKDPLPPKRAARLTALLDRLGVPAHPGRLMLYRATALAWQDRSGLENLRDALYPAAAAPFDATAAQAERAIRHVIDAAWRSGAIDEQHRIFGNTIDARRGRPTCGEMIAQLADILRWEG